MKHIFLSAIMLCVSISLDAQDQSPIINGNVVTFRLEAPSAKKVQVEGTFVPPKRAFHHKTITILKQKPVDMVKDASTGVWTYTTDTLASEMYTYRFIVDGKDSLDPCNTARKVRDVADWYNYFFIEGKLATYYENQDIPHGTIEKVWYPSSLNGMSQRRMFIYLPSGYAASDSIKYPVLYLLHGSGGDETSWSDYGRVCQILDGMIERGEIEPLIVVMPNGNVTLDAAPGESPYMDKEPSASNVSSMFGKYEKSFVPEIVTYVDKNYRTLADKHHRAIAGLSLGGLHTIYISANNPTCFDYVGLFSAQTTNMLDSKKGFNLVGRTQKTLQDLRNIVSIMKGNLPENTNMTEKLEDIDIYKNVDEKLANQFATPPALYYIACGSEDFVLELNNNFREKLDKAGYTYIYNPSTGGHTWENWRKYLIDYLPRLFK